MSEIVATFKPKRCRDWSYYCRLKVILGGGWGDYLKGQWSVIGGTFFPFSRDFPNQARSGEWCYVSRAGALSFWDVYPDSWYATFRSVHWNWRVLCTHRELCGQGYISTPVTPNDVVVWVMGPGVKHPPQLIQTADPAQTAADHVQQARQPTGGPPSSDWAGIWGQALRGLGQPVTLDENP
jgi:hypothetical protein